MSNPDSDDDMHYQRTDNLRRQIRETQARLRQVGAMVDEMRTHLVRLCAALADADGHADESGWIP